MVSQHRDGRFFGPVPAFLEAKVGGDSSRAESHLTLLAFDRKMPRLGGLFSCRPQNNRTVVRTRTTQSPHLFPERAERTAKKIDSLT